MLGRGRGRHPLTLASGVYLDRFAACLRRLAAIFALSLGIRPRRVFRRPVGPSVGRGAGGGGFVISRPCCTASARSSAAYSSPGCRRGSSRGIRWGLAPDSPRGRPVALYGDLKRGRVHASQQGRGSQCSRPGASSAAVLPRPRFVRVVRPEQSPCHAALRVTAPCRAATGAGIVSLLNFGIICSRLAACHTAAAMMAASFFTSSGMMRS